MSLTLVAQQIPRAVAHSAARRVALTVALALVGSILSTPRAQAGTYLVLPDGSGDFPNIQAAIDGAKDGDAIELGYGRFTGTGNRDLWYRGKAIAIRSQSGHPETCIIDCEGSPVDFHRGFTFEGEGPESILQGVTIENGNVDMPSGSLPECGGGGILILGAASPTFRNVTIRHCGAFAAGGVLIWSGSPRFTNCRFVDNASCGGGGGYCFDGSPEFTDCVFEDNHPLQSGGGFGLNGPTTVATFTNCVFRNNECLHCGWGGGINVFYATALVHGCTFISNRTYGRGGTDDGGSGCAIWNLDGGGSRDCEGGAIGVTTGHAIISGCTFVGNTAPHGGAIGVDSWEMEPSIVEIKDCIIAFNSEGAALTCGLAEDQVSIECTDVYGNAGGDWVGCIAGLEGANGNLSADPRFCDLPGEDLTLDPTSPCAPENSGDCGLIGAWPVGCDASDAPLASGLGDRSLYVVPNPVSDECRFELCGHAISARRVQILDVGGRVVRDLIPSAVRSDGDCVDLWWDTRDNRGRRVASGIYLVRSGAARRHLVVGR